MILDVKKFWILLLTAMIPVVRLPAAAFSAILSLWLGLATPVAASYDEGAAAFIRGDYEIASREWLALGERGHQSAQYNLGVLYSIGLGVDQNDIEASKWFRRAADRGLPAAQMRLGTAYLEGKGVSEDLKEAYFWFTLAATHFSLGEQHEQAVAARESTGAGLTRVQITEVLEKAMSWKPLPQAVEESESERLIAEPNGESALNLDGGDPNGLSSGSASLAATQPQITQVQSEGEASGTQDTQNTQDTESGMPETQITEVAETPNGSSEASEAESGEAESGAAESGAGESGAGESTGGETAATQAVEAQNGEPVEQEAIASSSGQAEAAAAEDSTAAEDNRVELANATEASGSEAQDAAETRDQAARDTFAAHLSSVRYRDGTESEWQNLQGRYPVLLDGRKLAVTSIEVADQGTFYRVMAGPIDDFDEAQDLCSQLQANDQYCVVRRLNGDSSQ